MAHIAIAGFQHETNTFGPSKAEYSDFEIGGGWPALQRGKDILSALCNTNIPAAGFIEVAATGNHTLSGLVWTATTPSAHVTSDAFERIAGEIEERLLAAMPVDALYLDLHGAMVAEEFDDGEGELLRRLRKIVGSGVPIVASLDLHANVTQQMFDIADGLVAYRSYPHTDMAETGAAAYRLLSKMLQKKSRPHKEYRTFEFLTAIPSQCTLIEPAKSIYQDLEELEKRTDSVLSFTPGFPMADFPECGMAVFGYSWDSDGLNATCDEFARRIAEDEQNFVLDLLSPEQAVRRAIEIGRPGAPVILADAQDNPGAGADGDTTGILRELFQQGAKDALLGVLIDPKSAEKAHQAGTGQNVVLSLGGITAISGNEPVDAEFRVESVSDGCFTCTGPMFGGCQMNLGPMALLERDGVRVVVASKKKQAADQEMFRHLGAEPKEFAIVVLKSSVHFRADFQPIAHEILVVAAPGPALNDPMMLPWKRLRRGLRLRPLGPAFMPLEVV